MNPHAYARLGGTFHIRGAVPAAGAIELVYYGQATPLVNPTDSNELTSACPDALIYAALSFAGDHFEHPTAAAWEARYGSIMGAIQGDVVRLENTGGPAVIQPFVNWSA